MNAYLRPDRIFGTASAAAMLVLLLCPVAGSRAAGSDLRIGADDIGGSVASSRGPEAGVWVIAETNDFHTRFAKIVVTDDQGRYLVPGSSPANYLVWVRGYGLADSAKVRAVPGIIWTSQRCCTRCGHRGQGISRCLLVRDDEGPR